MMKRELTLEVQLWCQESNFCLATCTHIQSSLKSSIDFFMFGQYHSIYWALISLIKGCPPLEEFQDINIFGEKCREMPFEDVTKAQIKKWRPAGYHSQRNAAAAMGFLLSHGPRIDLTLLESAWTGVLLLKGRTTVQITWPIHLNQHGSLPMLSRIF